MTESEILWHINEGTECYLDFLGDGEHMIAVDNGRYKTICPKEREKGVRFVYRVRHEADAAEIAALNMPVWWGLQGDEESYMAVTDIANVPEFGMADVREVGSACEFEIWAEAVNAYLHEGYPYIHPRNHYKHCETGRLRCYALYEGAAPVAFAAILNNGGICSLEFVVTHPDRRRKGHAKAVCERAVREAFKRGAKMVTLRASNPGTKELYTALGFKSYNHAI